MFHYFVLCTEAILFVNLLVEGKAGRRRKTCPVCLKDGLLKLSGHLKIVHGLEGETRKSVLKEAVCSGDKGIHQQQK